jgi:DNA ligase-1
MQETLSFVISHFEQIEQTSGRLEMRDTAANLYKELSAQEAAMTTYLLLGRLTPDFVPVEFQIAGKTLEKIVKEALSLSDETFTQVMSEAGDAGSVFAQFAGERQSEIKTVTEAYETLWKIARIQGKGSQQLKQAAIQSFLQKLDAKSGKYILRILNGKLRLGASDKTILDAISTYESDPKQFSEILRKAAGMVSDVGYIAYIYKTKGREGIEHISFVPGVPVASKLVEREATIDDVFTRIPEGYVEPKYDGLRIQVHAFKEEVKQKSFGDRVWFSYMESDTPTLFAQSSQEIEVKLYSRNLEDMTDMFPEITEAAKTLLQRFDAANGTSSNGIVLDGEVIGYNDAVNQFMTYQETMTRRRKHNVGDAQLSVPVRIFVFDILYKEGAECMSLPLSERKELLSFLDTQEKEFQFTKTPFHITKSSEEADKIFMEYVAEGLEGVIFKDGSTFYEPGVRNFDWIKFKRSMKKELADTVDLVLLGYYFGEGRLAKYGIGALLAGVYDEEKDMFVTVTKIGTGITDELWQEIKSRCNLVAITEQDKKVIVPNSLVPNVWLAPEIVVEVEADEITKSPLHTSGLALRFPRFMRFREKKAEDATSLKELQRLSTL